MHWERAPFLAKEPIFKFVMAPNEELSNDVDGPNTKGVETGPMALSYDPKEGWVVSNFGPNNGHWKRLVREEKQNKPKGEKKGGAKPQKREGPTPIQELDPNLTELKRRKGLEQFVRNLGIEVPENKTESMDGEVAVSTEQHRQAS